MKCKIMHESEGRLRIRAEKSRMTLREADILEYYMKAVPGVNDVKVYDRTCDAVILYEADRRTSMFRLRRPPSALQALLPALPSPRSRISFVSFPRSHPLLLQLKTAVYSDFTMNGVISEHLFCISVRSP